MEETHAPRRMRLLPELLTRLPERVDEEGPVTMSVPDAWYPAEAARVLADLGDAPLWVFAAGSLIWNPRMEVAERRRARIHGWSRAFCLGPMRRRRGSPSAPGLMLSLARGGACEGVVMQMQADDRAAALEALLKLEPPVPTTWVDTETDAGPVRAIAFTLEPGQPLYADEPDLPDLADILSKSVGTHGTMAEYLLNTVRDLEAAGIHDPHLWQLQDLVAERLEARPALR